MSTPLNEYEYHKHPKQHHRVPTAEISEKMQAMIALQNEQLHRYTSDETLTVEDSHELWLSDRTSSPNGSTPFTTTRNSIQDLPLPPAVKRHNDFFLDPAVGPDPSVGTGTMTFFNLKQEPPTSPAMSDTTPPAPLQKRSESTSILASLTRTNLAGMYGSTNIDDLAQVSTHPPTNERQEHDYHGFPDYFNDPVESPPRRRSKSRALYSCAAFVQRFMNCCRSESLHRSFCYGAIDGLLTGSGIVAGFCGMQVLLLVDTNNSHNNTAAAAVRTFCVCLSLAACFADSVCMAIGHVWTTRVVALAHAKDRHEARLQLRQSKVVAKSQLVDHLLHRGMLKIDAMSLADTLEGYPDLFVSALTGESLLGDVSVWDQTGAQGVESSSYIPRTDLEMDSEDQAVATAIRDSVSESLFMMTGFTLFALVPSLVFDAVEDRVKSQGQASHLILLVITSVSAIMWLLGVWKSRFVADGNWIVFGFETVFVLLVCTAAAYGLGAFLKSYYLAEYTFAIIKKSGA
jgi:hypothetical protein